MVMVRLFQFSTQRFNRKIGKNHRRVRRIENYNSQNQNGEERIKGFATAKCGESTFIKKIIRNTNFLHLGVDSLR